MNNLLLTISARTFVLAIIASVLFVAYLAIGGILSDRSARRKRIAEEKSFFNRIEDYRNDFN